MMPTGAILLLQFLVIPVVSILVLLDDAYRLIPEKADLHWAK